MVDVSWALVWGVLRIGPGLGGIEGRPWFGGY